MSKRGHYSVSPRYSAGSPAMVDERIALRVAEHGLHPKFAPMAETN